MAKFVTSMDDGLAADIVDAFCWEAGYAGPPEDKPAFAQARIAEYMQGVVRQWKIEIAKAAAVTVAAAEVSEAFKANPITISSEA